MSERGFEIAFTIQQDNVNELYQELLQRSTFAVYGEFNPTYKDRIDLRNVSHRVFPISIKENTIRLYIDIIDNERGNKLIEELNNNPDVYITPNFITEKNGETEYITKILTINLTTKTNENESN